MIFKITESQYKLAPILRRLSNDLELALGWVLTESYPCNYVDKYNFVHSMVEDLIIYLENHVHEKIDYELSYEFLYNHYKSRIFEYYEKYTEKNCE